MASTGQAAAKDAGRTAAIADDRPGRTRQRRSVTREPGSRREIAVGGAHHSTCASRLAAIESATADRISPEAKSKSRRLARLRSRQAIRRPPKA